MRLSRYNLLFAALLGVCLQLIPLHAADVAAPDGWITVSPREEIQPVFAYNPKGGPDHAGSFTLQTDAREGLSGCWKKTFPIQGDRYYRFSALRKLTNVPVPRRCAVARVIWLDAKGQKALLDAPETRAFRAGSPARSEPEYPTGKATDAHGWT